MFQKLIGLLRPYTVDDLIEELVPGYGARRARRIEEHDADKRQRHEKETQARLEQQRFERERELRDPYWARRESERERELLELQLKDAEWILDYEKRLAKLQAKTTAQRSKTAHAGINTDRLRKLEHHIAGLRQNLSLD